MKTKAKVFLLTFCSLILFSCDSDWVYMSYNKPDNKTFANDLRGTWETNSISDYSGTLVIGSNNITISGYAPNTSYELTYGTSRRPFRDFTKNVSLEGYTEEGKIFIKDAGIIQEGIPYTYWDGYQQPDNELVQFIRFDFGGRVETLQKR